MGSARHALFVATVVVENPSGAEACGDSQAESHSGRHGGETEHPPRNTNPLREHA
jgi:hypothetical protein